MNHYRTAVVTEEDLRLLCWELRYINIHRAITHCHKLPNRILYQGVWLYSSQQLKELDNE